MDILKLLIIVPICQIIISFIPFFLGKRLDSVSQNYLMIALQQVFAVFLPAFLFLKKHKISYLKEKDFKIERFSDINIFILLGIGLQFTGTIFNLPIALILEKFGFAYKEVLPPVKSFSELITLGLVACVMPAVFEEVLFRKIVFNRFRHFSKQTAIITSSIFFSLAHMSFYNLGAAFFIGIVFGIMRAREYPLVSLMVAHFTVNFSAVLLNTIFSKEAYKLAFANYYFLILIIFSIIVTLILKDKPKKSEQLEIVFPIKPLLIELIKTPYPYIYFTIIIVIGVINL
jgi:membrane protease YdiL (CAAX protease family)